MALEGIEGTEGIRVIEPLLGDAAAGAMVELWHSYGTYGQYSNEGFATSFAPELAQRYDAAANFVRTGGRFGRREDVRLAAARTNYFRETYFYGEHACSPGIEAFRDDEGLRAAAQELHGRPVVVPAIVYANILLPGQELAVHTDVPEFRGANRRIVPQWLLVVMRHAELFESWRMPIATAIAYFGDAEGGDLAYYPDGPDGPAAVYAPRHDTAAVLDTDSVFHGVDRVAGDDAPLGRLKPGMQLHHDGDRRWSVRDSKGDVTATYGTDDLRYSVSWKAYCFADDAERTAWAEHHDDLSLDRILDTLEDDLRHRGRLAGPRPEATAFGKLLIDEYIRFPVVNPR
ncbi:MAG TPA: hypothetical protein VGO78_29620 [Acidimicrobiales bacterium]|nr:hypothetical protein [Acidimicrobiales bacterium]